MDFHVLIVKTSSLGDILHAFPVAQYIKERHPHAKIDWVVEQSFASLVNAHPSIDRVLVLQTKRWRSQPFNRAVWREVADFLRELRCRSYDLIFDLQGNIKSGCVTALSKGEIKAGFGFSSAPERPNVLATNRRFNPPKGKNICEDYLFLAQSTFGDFTRVQGRGVVLRLASEEEKKFQSVLERIRNHSGMNVLICPGSHWPNKQLSSRTLRDFLESFLEWRPETHFLLLWGGEAEKEGADELAASLPVGCASVLEKLPLPALQSLMGEVDLVVAMDSLPLHLAGTTSTPTFSVFGPSKADKYKPVGASHYAVQGACPYGKLFEKRCPLLRSCRSGACMKHLEGGRLFEEFLQWWSG